MILLDANLLLYAYDSLASEHSTGPILAGAEIFRHRKHWAILGHVLGFLRIATSRRYGI